MTDILLRTKRQLKNYIATNIRRKGWTDDMISTLIDVLWRDKFTMRTSGFVFAGGADAVIAWDDSTRTFTISPYDPSYEGYIPKFDFYIFETSASVVRKLEAESLQLPDEEGCYIIYYASDDTTRTQLLQYIKNPTTEQIQEVYEHNVIIAWIYWDYDNGQAIYFGDSRHGSEFIPAMHWQQHQTLNSQRQSGLGIANAVFDGTGASDADFEFAITSGELWHGDIFVTLSGVNASTEIPVWYFDASGNPRFTSQSGKKFLTAGSGRAAYLSAGTITEATNNYFVVYHLFATNDTLQPIISVISQYEYDTLGAAMAAVPPEIANLRQQMPHSNMMHIASAVFQTSDDYTNSAKTRLVSLAQDVITDKSITGTGTATNPITLENDEDDPGNKKYYGTGDQFEPEKGFHTLHSKLVNQTAHGFTVNTAIRDTVAGWVKAQANSAENATTGGIVVEVIDADNFRFQSSGFHKHAAFVRGKEYALSPTAAGEIIEMPDDTFVWQVGWVIQSLGWGTDRGLKVEISTGIVIEEETFTTNIQTEKHVTGDGTSGNKIRLKGDESSPLAANNYYGSDKDQNEGFFPLPAEAVQTLSSPADNFDMEKGRGASITLTADTTITFQNLQANDNGHIEVIQDSTGGWKLSFVGVPVEIAENSYSASGEVLLTGVANSKDVVAWWWTGSKMKLAVIYNTLS